MKKPGHISLVGAGCGGPQWLTLAGKARLEACDTVVYDALIHPALLDFAPPWAQRIPVGKRAGRHSETQGDINARLVALGQEGRQVVRLKGGDPYLFGRGGEEALALQAAGIPFDVVPGIPSALAIPLEAGIPVTHRGVSRSLHIVTAHTKEDALPDNLEQLAQLPGTLVFLMGLGSLEPLAAALIRHGKAPDTPAAVLSGGNAPYPARVTGTLADLAQKAALAKVQPPAIILVGEAAGLDLRDLAHAPLTGVKIGLTGTLPFQDKLRALLAPLGAQVFSVQSAQCHPLPAEIPWGEIQANPCWLAFTSARGVEFFFQRVRQEEVDLRLFARCRFAVIGQETGRTLKSYGFTPDLCPEVFTSQALAEELAQLLPAEETLWLFQAELGSDALAVKLGKQCRTIPLYGAEYGPVSPGPVPDYLLFGSGGGVRALAQTGYALDPHTTPVCIGPVAADACRTLFSRDPLVPPAATTQSMTDLLLAQAEK